MPTLETTRLQLQAVLAGEMAKEAAARAAQAETEEQLRALRAQGTLRSTISGGGYFLAAVFVVFVAWAYMSEPPASTRPPAPYLGPPPVPDSTKTALQVP